MALLVANNRECRSDRALSGVIEQFSPRRAVRAVAGTRRRREKDGRGRGRKEGNESLPGTPYVARGLKTRSRRSPPSSPRALPPSSPPIPPSRSLPRRHVTRLALPTLLPLPGMKPSCLPRRATLAYRRIRVAPCSARPKPFKSSVMSSARARASFARRSKTITRGARL